MGSSESKPSKATRWKGIKQSLTDSIKNRDIERTGTILKQFKSDSILRVTDSNGNPAVHLAVEAGTEMLEMLLDSFDADTRLRLSMLIDMKGRSALYLAAKQNYSGMVKKMITRVHPNELAALIDNDEYVDDIIVLSVILDSVDITEQSNLTMKWLNKAMGSQKWEAVQVLLSRIKPDNRMRKLTQHVDKFSHTIIHQFAMMEAAKGCAAIEAIMESIDIEERYILFSERDIDGRTPLDLACCTDRKLTALVILRYMQNFSVSQNREIISTDNSSSTPLHYVATRQFTEVIPLMRESLDLGYWKSLLILKDNNDFTPLALVFREGNENVTDEIRDSIPHSHWLELSKAYHGNSLPEEFVTQAMISEIVQETDDQEHTESDVYQQPDEVTEKGDIANELFTAIANAAKTDRNKQEQPNQQVEMRIIQDRIFESLKQFGDGDGSSSTISCILLTSLTQEMSEDLMSHLLILISGEISITSHHFNIGERFSWQISKEKFSDDRIHRLINDYCYKMQIFHLPDMMMLSIPPYQLNGGNAVPRLILPQISSEILSCRCDHNPLRFHLHLRGNGITANFQIYHKDEQVDEMISCFEQYESSSEGSDTHHIAEFIDQLDVDEDERCVTVVVMAALGSDDLSQYLLHLIAGRLTQPVVTPDNESWKDIQTHYVGNSSLYDEITRKSKEGLASLDPAKRAKVLDNPPRYVVTSNFPSRTFDEKFRISDVILPEVSHGNGEKQVYIYRNHDAPELCLELHEPASPMFSSYSNSGTTESSSLSVTDKNPMEDLDRKHYEMFSSIYSECDKQGSYNDTVSAITSVACLPSGEMTVGLFLLSGTWFGKGVADIHITPGWKVTVMPVFNPKLRKKVEAFTGSTGLPWCSTKDAKAAAITPNDLDSKNVLGAGILSIDIEKTRTSDVQGRTIWKSIRRAKISHSTQRDLCAVFSRIEEDELSADDLKKLSLPIPESLLDIATYEKFEEKLNISQENREDDSESVMISVHSLKTKLAIKKKPKRSKPGMQEGLKVCQGDPRCNILIILAVGQPSEICYPRSFRYQDPLNSWECQTFFKNSKKVKTIVEKEWSELKEKFRASKTNIWQSVAQHMVLDASSGPLKLVPLKLAGENSDKLKVQPSIIEFSSHDTDDQSIGHALASCQPFLIKCKEWHENEKSDSIFCHIRSAFFGEPSLPTSFKFPTSKFKHSQLPRPHQLGCSSTTEEGSLFLLYHDEAHMKMSQISQARSIKDKEIKEQLKKTWEVLDVNQNQLAEQGAVGGATSMSQW